MSLEDLTKGINKEAFLSGDREEQNLVMARFKEEREKDQGNDLANHLSLRMWPIDKAINFEKSQLATYSRERPNDKQGIDRHLCRVEMFQYFKDYTDVATIGGAMDLLESRGVPPQNVSQWESRGIFMGNLCYRPAVLAGYPELANMIWEQVETFLAGQTSAKEDILKVAELNLEGK
jgi:hypothetical protein